MRERLSAAHEAVGPCRVGISEPSVTTWFPAFVRRVHDEHRRLELKPRVGRGKPLERLVDRGSMPLSRRPSTRA